MTTPKTDRVTYQMQERKVGDLWVDPNVQRSLRKARVTAMAGDFRPDALGVLTTSRREGKRIHIIDGQHRYRAAEAAAFLGVIQTMEYRGLTIPEEAALFRLLNKTEKVSRVDQFLISCVEQDPASVRLAGFLAAHGWAVGASATESRLSAIASLERVYARSPEAADGTLAVLTVAYGHIPTAVQGSLIEGVGRMLARYGQDVNLTLLAKRLSSLPGGPNALLGNARGRNVARTGNLSSQVAQIITNEVYNKGLRSNALPEWT